MLTTLENKLFFCNYKCNSITIKQAASKCILWRVSDLWKLPYVLQFQSSPLKLLLHLLSSYCYATLLHISPQIGFVDLFSICITNIWSLLYVALYFLHIYFISQWNWVGSIDFYFFSKLHLRLMKKTVILNTYWSTNWLVSR